jgi:hypothetical protein
MLTALDFELYPDDCEVVEIPLHDQRVYLIQKNGSSSLRKQIEKYNYKLFSNQQIQGLATVDVYVRNPRARYISGVNTYLQHLARDHPGLDYNTAFWFAKRYKFLNRHYLPQLHWLANLSRYLSPHARLRFRDFAKFGDIVDINFRALVEPPSVAFVKKLLDDDPDLDFWLFLDQILLDLIGQTMTWQELLDYYKKNHYDVMKHVLSET